MGMIDLDLDIQFLLKSKVVCYVINAPTQKCYLGDLGSTFQKFLLLRQCFLFKMGRRIHADIRPFTVTESFYSDAQFYDLSSGTDKSKEVIVKK